MSKSLNLNDIKQIIKNEKLDIPVLNVMEYSTINVIRVKDTYVIIYKYPLITQKCKLFKITSLSYLHGKYILEKYIAQCNINNYSRVKECKQSLNNFICKTNKDNECISKSLKEKANCKTIEETNANITILDYGNIILDGKYEINNETISGVNLIQFNDTIKINGRKYTNIQDTIKQIIQHEGTITIDEVINSNEETKFTNIRKLHKLLIPFEDHPIQTCYTITTFEIIILIIWTLLKLIKLRQVTQERKKLHELQQLTATFTL